MMGIRKSRAVDSCPDCSVQQHEHNPRAGFLWVENGLKQFTWGMWGTEVICQCRVRSVIAPRSTDSAVSNKCSIQSTTATSQLMLFSKSKFTRPFYHAYWK